jgi:hypothetical protein
MQQLLLFSYTFVRVCVNILICVILFLSTVVTHMLYETNHFFGENTNTIRADRLPFSMSPTTKNITSLKISFTYLLKKSEKWNVWLVTILERHFFSHKNRKKWFVSYNICVTTVDKNNKTFMSSSGRCSDLLTH